MKQLLAVGVAALLVALALVARGAIDDSGDDTDGPGTDEPEEVGDLVVACVTELADVCGALDADVRVQDPGDTIATADDVDAWITFDPWPDIAAEQEGRIVFRGEPVSVASSPLVLLARDGATDCDAVTWSCLLDAGVSVSAPRITRALGPMVLAHAGVAVFGSSFARNDLEQLGSTLRRIDRRSGDPVADMLQLFPAGPPAAGTTEADVESRVETAARADDFTASDGGAPAIVAVVVAGPSAGEIADDDAFLEALTAAGWTLDPDAATAGLPNAGVLLALTQEFR